jgi:hypothetical protein
MTLSTAEQAVFAHRRLSTPRSIRILQLHTSAVFDSPLHVTLSESVLDHGLQQYEALSYIWGASKGSRSLFCDKRILLVTPSCEAALRHLRLENQDRFLWIDAICIDQAEDVGAVGERNIQVPLMGEIYSGASRTYCWLGEGLEFTPDVLKHLQKIGECPSKRGLQKLMEYEGKYATPLCPHLQDIHEPG